MRIKLLVFMVALAVVAMAVPVSAGGNGKGLARKEAREAAAAPATCTVDGNTVYGENLPPDLTNFMVMHDGAMIHGWVLGHSYAGTWTVSVPDRTGPATYQFTSATWGKNGSKYTVFASCSAA
ncbi:MAG: hypothetical protein HKN74_12880 [Acidimicrobiia bacterium]|nr:hypothetical protein [Acidimicrobiia bacterium]NNF11168.1 hypothetical protein [Acidimicrobiia bacterium]NNL69328.1 hypothetical protein [Acidimicrobiia bacterium]